MTMISDALAVEASGIRIREVYRDNFKKEGEKLLLALNRYNTIAFDTEYPGAIDQTPQFADDEKRYKDLKSNVERTKLIQVGFTIFDPITSEVGGVWQFNLAGFNPKLHDHSSASVQLLEKSGIDFGENLKKGVRMTQFTRLLKRIRDDFSYKIQWITFHGLYDAAYLLAAMSGVWKIPNDIEGFAETAGELFGGGIFDLKLMAGDYSWMGLEKLAAAVGEEREHGRGHQAGSDSLLTAKVFLRAVMIIETSGTISVMWFRGLLFGIQVPILSSRCCTPIEIEAYYANYVYA